MVPNSTASTGTMTTVLYHVNTLIYPAFAHLLPTSLKRLQVSLEGKQKKQNTSSCSGLHMLKTYSIIQFDSIHFI